MIRRRPPLKPKWETSIKTRVGPYRHDVHCHHCGRPCIYEERKLVVAPTYRPDVKWFWWCPTCRALAPADEHTQAPIGEVMTRELRKAHHKVADMAESIRRMKSFWDVRPNFTVHGAKSKEEANTLKAIALIRKAAGGTTRLRDASAEETEAMRKEAKEIIEWAINRDGKIVWVSRSGKLLRSKSKKPPLPPWSSSSS